MNGGGSKHKDRTGRQGVTRVQGVGRTKAGGTAAVETTGVAEMVQTRVIGTEGVE